MSANAYGPVSFKYQANPYYAEDNWAVLVPQSNITIAGSGAGTTLVAFNRDTTILYIGGAPNGRFGQPVTDIKLQNITFQGNPAVDFLGANNSTGVANVLSGQNDNIGSLVVFSGLAKPNNSQRLLVQNCTFSNPSTVAVALYYAFVFNLPLRFK